jgi:tetratricopeptide (TPR) repeat protein
MKAALADYTRALELDPENAEACHQRAVVHKILGRHDLALKDYERLFTLRPTARNLGEVATLRFQQGAREDSLRDFNLALQMAPTDPLLHAARSAAYRELGRFTEALADVEKAIDLYRRQPGFEADLALPSLERHRDALRGR